MRLRSRQRQHLQPHQTRNTIWPSEVCVNGFGSYDEAITPGHEKTHLFANGDNRATATRRDGVREVPGRRGWSLAYAQRRHGLGHKDARCPPRFVRHPFIHTLRGIEAGEEITVYWEYATTSGP